jgi:hypothetical protein
MTPQNQLGSVGRSATVTIPELQQSKTAVLNTLASRADLFGILSAKSAFSVPGMLACLGSGHRRRRQSNDPFNAEVAEAHRYARTICVHGRQ